MMKRFNLKVMGRTYAEILTLCEERSWTISFLFRLATDWIVAVWLARQGGGMVVVLNKQGQVDREILIPW